MQNRHGKDHGWVSMSKAWPLILGRSKDTSALVPNCHHVVPRIDSGDIFLEIFIII